MLPDTYPVNNFKTTRILPYYYNETVLPSKAKTVSMKLPCNYLVTTPPPSSITVCSCEHVFHISKPLLCKTSRIMLEKLDLHLAIHQLIKKHIQTKPLSRNIRL